MFTMSYVNGVYPVSYNCYHERFHNMNACHWYDGNKHIFQSYQTVIAFMAESKHVNYLVVDQYFDCSASTRKQFSRWLNEFGYPSYASIKKAFEKAYKEYDYDIDAMSGEWLLDDDDFVVIFCKHSDIVKEINS